MSQSIYVKFIEKVQKKLEDKQDIAGEQQTLSDLLEKFFYVPEFYTLPFDVTVSAFEGSQKKFTQSEIIFVAESFCYILKKAVKKILNYKISGGLTGSELSSILKEIPNWDSEDSAVPAEPPQSMPNVSQHIVDMIKQRQKARVEKIMKKNDQQLNRLKQAIMEVGKEENRVNREILQIQAEARKPIPEITKEHEEKMKELQHKAAAVEYDIGQAKEREAQFFTAESHRLLMDKLKEEHKQVIQELNDKIASEITEIQDIYAVATGGKTSKEIAAEKAKEEAEERERKKKGIPKNFAPFVTDKIIQVKPIFKQKAPKKPTKIRTIFDAIALNDIEAVKNFVQKDKRNLRELDEGRITPLHKACMCNNAEIAKYLISEGADINAKDVNKMTPLHYACIEASDQLISLLAESKADTQIENNKNQKPSQILELRDKARKDLFNSLEKGEKDDKKIVIDIFKQWPDMINRPFSKGMRPIHLAAGFGHPEMIELLLQYGADIEALDNKLNTPLHYAAMYNKPEAIKYLIQHGADFHAINTDEFMPSDLWRPDLTDNENKEEGQ